MKPATEILLSAAFVLTPKENWTQHVLARDKDGHRVNETAPTAVSWCALGAVIQCGDDWSRAWQFFREAAAGDGVIFNNTHTHAEVLDALYRAAEIAEAS